MLSVVTWFWMSPKGYRSTFGAARVNALFRMVRRHYPHPLRCICVTDHPQGIDADIEIVPDWRDFERVPALSKRGDPSCYRRLRAWHPDVGTEFGQRFVTLDLDVVIVRDVAPLWNRAEDCVLLRDARHKRQYNGSMVMLKAGARPSVWSDFNPERSPRIAKDAGYLGSDQAWISYRLPREATWSAHDGVFSFWHDRDMVKTGRLPKEARIVSFCGKDGDPWSASIQRRLPWVREHYGAPA